jgi:hypothetical protein
MKKSTFSKILTLIFLFAIIPFGTVSLQSCSKKPKYNTRNGGKKINSSGHIGNRKHKNKHVWGQ